MIISIIGWPFRGQHELERLRRPRPPPLDIRKGPPGSGAQDSQSAGIVLRSPRIAGRSFAIFAGITTAFSEPKRKLEIDKEVSRCNNLRS